jgi:hypothetical protein
MEDKMGVEEKMKQAASLMKEAASELDKLGLTLNFEIKITARPQSIEIEVAPLHKKAPKIIEDIPTELLGLTLREFGNRYAETERFQRHIKMIEQLVAIETRDQKRQKARLQAQQDIQAQPDTPAPAQSS